MQKNLIMVDMANGDRHRLIRKARREMRSEMRRERVLATMARLRRFLREGGPHDPAT